MKILIANCFEWTPEYPPVHDSHNVGEWFLNAFGEDPAQFEIWRVQKEKAPPSTSYGAAVIGGSLSSVYDSDPWIRRLEDYAQNWIGRRIPLLGVCFGHQLIARILGGTVERNPNGWEIGACQITLSQTGKSDPLFHNIPESFPAMQTHQDAVIEMPPQAESMASSRLCPIQAYRIGETIRSIQFHPEFTPGRMRFILRPHLPDLQARGIDCQSIDSGLQQTPESQQVFSNFHRYFIDK